MSVFLELNDNCATLNSLFNKITESFVNDAVVNVTIKNTAGDVLVNAQAMVYVSGSDGIYRAVIASTVDLGASGDTVSVEVNGTAGDGSIYRSIGDTVYIRTRKLSSI